MSESCKCGRVFSNECVCFQLHRIEGIKGLDTTVTGTQIQFVFAMQWMRSAIPSFSELIRCLSSFLKQIYKNLRRDTNGAAAKVLVSRLERGPLEESTFINCKNALKH